MTQQLELSLLGTLRIAYNGQLITTDLPLKAQAMLCYLASTRETHTRQALAGLFWGDSPEDKALTSLRVTLNRLRKLLPDALAVTHLTIAHSQACDSWLDTKTFETQVQAAGQNSAALRAALDLYRGDFLANFVVDDADDFAEWVRSQRAHYQQLALNALSLLTENLLADHAYGEAVSVLARRIAIEPWAEDAHRLLMLIYSRMGNSHAALTQYKICTETLKRELGVEPMPETVALYERIQAARTSHPAHLPAESTPFVGRETELAQILNLLINPGSRLVTITGFGGMGKTRLAEEAARRANGEPITLFLNGVAFVPLADIQTAETIPLLIADVLGADLPGHRDPLRELLGWLENRETLLVLDNFEQLMEGGVPILGQILEACPAVKLLVTSREPLNLASEWRLDLEGLAYPPPRPDMAEESKSTPAARPFLQPTVAVPFVTEPLAKDLSTYDAVQLFLQTARQAQPHFTLDDETASHIHQICTLVAGIPLAIKLAAGWLRTMPVARIAAEVRQNLDLLSTELHDVPLRQRSMRVVFDYTWNLLQPDEKDIFCALAVFQGGFTDDAVAALSERTDGRGHTTFSPHVLAGLVDRSLVQVGFGPLGIRYSIHELLRQFGRQRLAAEPTEEAAVRSRHSHYYLRFLYARKDALAGQAQQTALDEVAQEIENVRAGWLWAIAQHDVAAIAEALDCLYRFYWIRSRAREGRDLFAHAATHLQSETEPDRLAAIQSRLTNYWGMFCYFLGDYEEASAHLNSSLVTARTFGLHETAASALTTLGAIAAWQGNRQAAQDSLRESLSVWRAIGHESGTADALHELAQLCALMGEFDEARQLSEESLLICRRIGRADWIGYALDTLGWAELALGDYENAHRHYEESRATFEELGHQLGVALALGGTASVAWARGGDHLATAQKQMMRSLVICREIGHLNHQASRLWYLAQLANDRGDYLEAQRFSQEGLAIARELGNAVLTGFNLGALGVAKGGLGDLTTSRAHLEEALRITYAEQLLPPMMIALYYFASLLVTEIRMGNLPPDLRPVREAQALAALDLLREQPTCWHIFRERAGQVRVTLLANLSNSGIGPVEAQSVNSLESLMATLLSSC